jgi:hypothetical protein
MSKYTQTLSDTTPAERWGVLRSSHNTAHKSYTSTLAYAVNGQGNCRVISGIVRRSRRGRGVRP